MTFTETLKAQSRTQFWVLFCLSLFFVALAQPSKIYFLCPIVSVCGYGTLWYALGFFSRKKAFLMASFWFFVVQLSWHSWLCSTKYQGLSMVIIYVFLCAFFAFQFGLISLIAWKKNLSWKNILLLPATWTLLEMARVYILSGYLWSPVGLSLSAIPTSMQWASLGGIYLLTFWVMLSNVFFLKVIKEQKNLFFLGLIVSIPYFYGLCYEYAYYPKKSEKKYSALLVQTGLYPEEKNSLSEYPNKFLRPLEQWRSIFQSIQKQKDQLIDLIVLPEAALPFRAYFPFYSLEDLKYVWRSCFKEELYFPRLLKEPFARFEYGQWIVSNAFINQALCRHFDCELICGLDHSESGKSYNSAFHFAKERDPSRYDKQILVPVGEYMPFSFLKSVAAQFGILGGFTKGEGAKIFSEKIPLGVSICLEEIYPELIRENRSKGANLFVNITNDGWFPGTTLPRQHFDHGMLRAVENGVFLFRACNTGITAAIDPFGRVVKSLSEKETTKEALHVEIPYFHIKTPYTFWGNNLIFGICFLICMLNLRGILTSSSE